MKRLKRTVSTNKQIERVLYFNPIIVYKRIKKRLNPYKRKHNSREIGVKYMFPSIKGYCACGCKRRLKGKQRKWASKQCSDFAYNVYSIFAGHVKTIRYYMNIYQNGNCNICKEKLGSYKECDHILPVYKGGGGCWLDNYQLIHKECHLEKTKEDLKKE